MDVSNGAAASGAQTFLSVGRIVFAMEATSKVPAAFCASTGNAGAGANAGLNSQLPFHAYRQHTDRNVCAPLRCRAIRTSHPKSPLVLSFEVEFALPLH